PPRVQGPDALLLLGDLCSHGREDAAWDDDFFRPAGRLLRNRPTLAIRGNHEEAAPLFDWMFPTPSGIPNWTLRTGPVTLIGVDGALDWREGGGNHVWLHQQLKAARTPFVFLINHYPAYASASHGRLAEDGLPLEDALRACRESIFPLAVQHGVTAMFHGHEHGYERSLLPGGVTAIICAGGGGRIYAARNDPRQNPFAVCRKPEHHFGLLRVEPESCCWSAVSLSGDLLDQIEFSPRGSIS
ncbi:MAG: metallophosphoesterase, partial [Opitutales bacterium]